MKHLLLELGLTLQMVLVGVYSYHCGLYPLACAAFFVGGLCAGFAVVISIHLGESEQEE
jgi:hypothetical protein